MSEGKLRQLANAFIGRHALRGLLKRFGSPLYIMDAQRIDRQAIALTRVFKPPRYRLYYAVKANPRVAITRRLIRHGLGCDATGIGDVQVALRAGCSPTAISVTGVGFSRAELEQLIRLGVSLNLDSIDELTLYCALRPGCGIGLRVNPRVMAGFHPHVAAGAPGGKLGIDIDDLSQALAIASAADIVVHTLHVHIGSLIYESEPYVSACETLLGIAADLPSVTTLNLGGGFGIPYDAETPTFPINDLERQLTAKIDRFKAQTGRDLVVALEPGDYLVGPTGYLAATVRVTKPSSRVAIVDASANLLPAVLLYGEPYPTAVVPVGGPRDDSEQTWTLCGRTNQAGDILAAGSMPPLQRGDILLFSMAGAYTACRASQFNQLPRPAEIIVDQHDARVIHAAEDHGDLIRQPVAAPPLPMAAKVQLDRGCPTSSGIDYGFAVDGERHRLSIRFSDPGMALNPNEIQVVTAAIGTLLAQLVLARRLEFDAGLPTGLLNALRPCLRLLYDVRCYCDGRPLSEPPALSAGDAGLAAPVRKAGEPRDGTLVALSGGFDSSLLLHLAARTDTRVEAVHFRVNETVRDEEERAARAIAEVCNVPLHIVDIDAPGLVDIGRRYSTSFGEFPRYNSVPHGRDLLLLPLAAVVARRRNLRRIAFGFDRESRMEHCQHHGQTIHRNDFASEHGFGLATALLRDHLDPGLTFEAPLWSVSGYRIRRAVLDHLPQLAAALQTCYWQRWCGRCVKCVTTALLQADTGRKITRFDTDMIDDPDNQYLAALLAPVRRPVGLPYAELATHILQRLASHGDGRHWVGRAAASADADRYPETQTATALCQAIDSEALRARFGQQVLDLFSHS